MAVRHFVILAWMLLIVVLPASLIGARQDEKSDNASDNCAVPLARLDGQRFKMDGAATAFGPGKDYIQTNDAALVKGLPRLGEYPVAIILLDFFTDPSSTSIGIPHGQLVESQVDYILAAAGVTSIPVDPVDISSNQTTDALSKILIQELQKYEAMHIHNFVINMSFAIVPCNEIPAQGQYAKDDAIKSFSDQLRKQIVFEPLITNLYRWECPGTPRHIDYIAAAGNASLNYPFFPASWPDVDSVGALAVDSNGQPTGHASYSNAATDWEIGAYWNSRANEAVQGTSFAAPTHSVRTALQLSETGKPIVTCMHLATGVNLFEPNYLFVNNQPNPQLVVSYTPSADSLTWTLQLQPDVTLDDGSPFNALVAAQKLNYGFNEAHDPFTATVVDVSTVEIKIPDPSQAASLQDVLGKVGFYL